MLPMERLHSAVIGRAAGHVELLSVSLGRFLDAFRLPAGVIVNTKDRCKERYEKHAHGAKGGIFRRLRIVQAANEEGLGR